MCFFFLEIRQFCLKFPMRWTSSQPLFVIQSLNPVVIGSFLLFLWHWGKLFSHFPLSASSLFKVCNYFFLYTFQVEAGVVHVAGQIGLIPGSMELPDNVELQAFLALRHLMRILDVYSMNATNLVQVINRIWLLSYLILLWNEVQLKWLDLRQKHFFLFWHIVVLFYSRI